MELHTLRYFIMVCQEKNISKAAKKLHISQPSLSKQIKALENELGVTLLIRGHRQVKLTEEGYFLLDRAKEMITIADSTTEALNTNKIVSGQLNIGAGQAPAMQKIMKIIDELLLQYPQIKINFKDTNADDIEKMLNNGTLDFGIVMGEWKLEEYQSIILPMRNEFVAIFNKNIIPLAQKEKITPQDLVSYPIMMSNQTLVNEKFKKWWGNLDDQKIVNFSANLAYNSALLAQEGHEIMISYKGLVNTKNTDLIEKPLSPKITDANILIWKKNTTLTNLEKLFIDKVYKLLK